MFDIAGTELLLLIIIAIIVVGPKDLPRLMRSLGSFVRKARMVARDFQRNFEDIANEADLQEFRKQGADLKKQAKGAVDRTLKPFDDINRIGGEEEGDKKKAPEKKKKSQKSAKKKTSPRKGKKKTAPRKGKKKTGGGKKS